jgi:hypothetical protein
VRLVCLILLATACAAQAEEGVGAAEALAQKKLNPLANAVYLPAMLNLGFGPHGETQPAVNFQPRIPLGLTNDWRIVTRSNVPIIRLPAPEETTGLADIDISLFLTPARSGAWVWGIGPIVQLPTATDTALGTGKWSAGPTAALVYVEGPWTNGILVSHLWSVAGPGNRADVSLTQIEVQLSYTFSNGWYIQSAPAISHDWHAPGGQRWVIPIGADVGRAFKVGSQEMGLQIGAYYNVKKPAGGAEWTLQTQISWLR